MKKHLIWMMILALLFVCCCVPLAVAAEETAQTVFTRVDLYSLTYGNNGTDTWSVSDDRVLSQTVPSGTKLGDCVAMSNISLEKGKAYTLEVKVRYTEPFSTQATDSRAIGLVFGANQINPWGSGGSAYCAMLDRAQGNGKHVRVFTRNINSPIQNTIGRPMTDEEFASTDWQTLRVTITESGVMTCYLDGVMVGAPSDESATWNGGLIGVNTYGNRTKIEIKDFAYTVGVTTEAAVYADDIAEKFNVTVHYVYSGTGEKAAEDVVLPVAKGQSYLVHSPEVENYVPDSETVSGVGTGAPIEVTVTYRRGYTLTIHYVRADGGRVYDDYVQSKLLPGTEYSVATVPIFNYEADLSVVSGTMGEADAEITVTFSPKKYKLTVLYCDADGNEVHTSYVAELEVGSAYAVTVPEVDGMVPNVNEVKGTLKKDTTVKVTYRSAQSDGTGETGGTEKPAGTDRGGCGSRIDMGAALLLTLLCGLAVTVVKRGKARETK
ncbi:MAG TPA: hypothetical protein DDW30_01150 [Clostridiales bacterium]|nr:hypothetical protein [Clostridiales bacterium]